MNKVAYTFLLGLFQIIALAQQNNLAVYKAVLQTSTSDAVKNNPVLQQVLSEITSNTNKEEYNLVFNQNESLFFPVASKEIKIGESSEMADLKLFNYKVYVNLLEEQLIKQPAPIEDKNFLIHETLNKYKWELFSEYKMIDSRKCFKAVLKNEDNQTTYNEVVAWYAPDIPFRFGPIEYNNLPGLILEITINDKITLYLTKIKLNSKETTYIEIVRPQNGKVVSENEYSEELKKYNEKMINLFKN